MAIEAAARAIARGTFPAGSARAIGASQTMSAPGTHSTTTAAAVPSGSPSSHKRDMQGEHGTSSGGPNRAMSAEAVSNLCPPGAWGISTIDNLTPPLPNFTPHPASNPYRIEGCGFGDKPGEVWLTGVHYQPGATAAGSKWVAPSTPIHTDWVKLYIYQNHWSNTTIDVVVDPNASGFLDTDNVTLLVITANGQQFQTAGFSFLPIYEEQRLTSIPPSVLSQGVITLAQVNDAEGHPITNYIYSPSDGSLVLPGHTLAVGREDNTSSFPGGTDSFDFTGHFITHVPLFQAALPAQSCQAKDEKFSTDGNWQFTWTASPIKFNISWQEQSCTVGSVRSRSGTSTGSISIYAVDIYVLVPRGTSPWNSQQ